MPDVIDLIQADHERIRRLLRSVEHAARHCEDAGADLRLAQVWRRVADLLELHAEAEQEICYVSMFGRGSAAATGLRDAMADNDDLREALLEARLHPLGSPVWWKAASSALRACRDHLDRVDRGVLADFGGRIAPGVRDDLARQWAAFAAARRRDERR